MKNLFFVLTMLVVSTGYATDLPPCQDAQGRLVKVVFEADNVRSPAYSVEKDGQPYIVFNENYIRELSLTRSVLGYVYLHECGHQVLGHTLNPSHTASEQKRKELEADCWAAHQIKVLDQQNRKFIDINAVLKEILPWPTDPSHPSGQVRARQIAACYQQ